MIEIIPHYYLYGETSPEKELEFMHIETVENRTRVHEWEIEPHCHDDLFQLVYIEQGVAEAVMDMTAYPCNNEAIFIIPPPVIHGFKVEEGTRGYVLSVAAPFLNALFNPSERAEISDLFSQPTAIIHSLDTGAGKSLLELFDQIEHEFRHPQLGRAQMIGAYLKQLFILIGRQAQSHNAAELDSTHHTDAFNRFRHLLEMHFRDHWSVRDYAEKTATSERRLSSICKRLTSQKPSQIIHNRVIMEAKRQLAYTSMTVQEVAYWLGFKDPGYFSRFFTKQTGESASAFREKHRKTHHPA